ncbi:glycosyltransferase [Pedobacter sp. GR22-6]|uniref:glycosyltransferase n=1 Tax=Pedobacter sp. GR22-6 TaxID=3127957 RepID=UPI00307FC4F0
MSDIRFNYIITIHNKQDLIAEVLYHVVECMSESSEVFAVLDGCTDGSEERVNDIAAQYPNHRIHKIFENDVHELKSINAGILAATHQGECYNIILQDDVLLTDHLIESRLTALYSTMPNLGIVSLRHGANISRALMKNAATIPTYQYIESEVGHRPNLFKMLSIGEFIYKEIAIKSPICIPSAVVRKVGMPDERYAPWDDIAYCYAVSCAGFDNGVFAIPFKSDIEWGTTRKKIQHVTISSVQQKNLSLFKMQYNHGILPIKKIYNNKRYKIFSSDIRSNASVLDYLRDLTTLGIDSVKYLLKSWVIR